MATIDFRRYRIGGEHAERIPDFFQQVALVFLHRQDIVGFLLHDLFSNRTLAAHRIDRHDRAFQRQNCQKLGNGHNLIGFFIHLALSQHQVVAAGPGRNHVDDGFLPWLTCTAQRFAVNRYYFSRRQLGDRGYPSQEALFQLLRIQRRKYPVEGVVRGNAGRESEKSFQPIDLGLSIFLHVVPTLGPAQHRSDGDQHNLVQQVFPVTFHPRILQFSEISQGILHLPFLLVYDPLAYSKLYASALEMKPFLLTRIGFRRSWRRGWRRNQLGRNDTWKLRKDIIWQPYGGPNKDPTPSRRPEHDDRLATNSTRTEISNTTLERDVNIEDCARGHCATGIVVHFIATWGRIKIVRRGLTTPVSVAFAFTGDWVQRSVFHETSVIKRRNRTQIGETSIWIQSPQVTLYTLPKLAALTLAWASITKGSFDGPWYGVNSHLAACCI